MKYRTAIGFLACALCFILGTAFGLNSDLNGTVANAADTSGIVEFEDSVSVVKRFRGERNGSYVYILYDKSVDNNGNITLTPVSITSC